MNKPQIKDRNDIITLVDAFYDQVLVDPLIGFFFTEIAKIDRKSHMPKMYDFWESSLLGAANYRGNPMTAHIALHKKARMTAAHFERWKTLFLDTVDSHFEGAVADDAKQRAIHMTALMLFKLESSEQKGFIQ